MPPRALSPSLNERAFVLSALRSSLRQSGRSLSALRPYDLIFPGSHGSVHLISGSTTLIHAHTTSILSLPSSNNFSEGTFSVSISLSPQLSPNNTPGPPSQLETTLQAHLEAALQRPSILALDALCLSAGQSAWAVTLTIHILAADGGLEDACLAAGVASLLHARMAASEVVGREVRVFEEREREGGALPLVGGAVASVGVGIFGEEGEEVVVLDPDAGEEDLVEARIAVVADEGGEVRRIRLGGGGAVDARVVLGVVKGAGEQAAERARWVRERVREDLEKRKGTGQEERRAIGDR
ncbi:MAG: hypothetical protein M1814_001507 [Vezdaea aestivalis]|nr:MAG: hypothetical protein M1814_001507 [Vezdaea aestivalis]